MVNDIYNGQHIEWTTYVTGSIYNGCCMSIPGWNLLLSLQTFLSLTHPYLTPEVWLSLKQQ